MKFDNIITMNTSIIVGGRRHYFNFIMVLICLLYTSDAADD